MKQILLQTTIVLEWFADFVEFKSITTILRTRAMKTLVRLMIDEFNARFIRGHRKLTSVIADSSLNTNKLYDF